MARTTLNDGCGGGSNEPAEGGKLVGVQEAAPVYVQLAERTLCQEQVGITTVVEVMLVPRVSLQYSSTILAFVGEKA